MPADSDARTLGDELRAYFEKRRLQRPARLTAAIEAQIRRLVDSEAALRAPQVGQAAPDFTLAEARGGLVRLRDLLARRAVVVAFYRGGW